MADLEEEPGFESQYKTVEIPSRGGHEWGEPIYAWSEDNSSVTADRYCKHNMIHVDTETVGATSKVTKEPMQETDGERVYTSDAFTNSAFAVRAKTVTIPAGEHVLTALLAALVANRPRATLSVWYN